jgi:hypothetical protein
MRSNLPFPFEVPFDQLEQNLDTYIDEVFEALRSDFLTMPRGEGFVEYAVFEQGYEALKRVTGGFREVSAEAVIEVVYQVPITLVVLRAMLGFTPPEWAYVTSLRTGIVVPQGAARTIDRTVRLSPSTPLRARGGVTTQRIRALVETACQLLAEGATQAPGILHRLDKADTRQGLSSLQPIAELGVPYAMVLYERFLGRPFAGHRDSISELVGDVVESAIEAVLSDAGISFRKTRRAERVAGFDQAPDFIVPDEFNPQVVIEAKLTEDDGTARDKITRIQHLGSLSMQGLAPNDAPRFEVIACIAGRGFKVRREDMKKLLLATRGKVFTLENLSRLVECSRLKEFRTR